MKFTKLWRKLVIIKFFTKAVIIWSYEILLFSIHRICILLMIQKSMRREICIKRGKRK